MTKGRGIYIVFDWSILDVNSSFQEVVVISLALSLGRTVNIDHGEPWQFKRFNLLVEIISFLATLKMRS